MKKFFLSVLFIVAAVILNAQPELAKTPPMGWNSWNCFRENIDESKIKSIADAMVSSGMKDAGYRYIVIDDGWMTSDRDEKGHIIVNSRKFPNGIKPLADYIHGLGLKFGIYSAPGCFTCQKLMGSLGHEQTDADDYAAWGVDYLKYDWCNYPCTREDANKTSRDSCWSAFKIMRNCLNKTGRPILYSIHDDCEKANKPNAFPWVKEVANLRRSGDDIKDNWDRMLFCLETTANLWEHAGPGFWNDPDMLEVGNTTQERLWGGISPVKMNLTEYQSHFSMWCMVAAPLIAGNDLGKMKPEIIKILTNKEMIAVDQDALGKQGKRIIDNGDIEVWVKELSGNKRAVALFNRSSESSDISFNWEDIGLKGKLKIRDLWEHKDLGIFKDSFTGKSIPAHSCMVILAGK